MNKEKVLYNSQTYNVAKASIYYLLAFVALISLIMVISVYIVHSAIFVVTGWILICSVPFLFQRKYKRLFTRRVHLEFDDQGLLIKEYTIKNNTLIKEFTFTWSDIQSYKFSFSSSNTIYLVIYPRVGPTKSFSFKDVRNPEQVINEKSVFSLFHDYVRQYNSDKMPEEKITLMPFFFTTKSGTFVLYSLVILTVVILVIHFLLAPKTFGLSFMGFFILIGLLVKRKTDKTLYDKINKKGQSFFE